MRQILLAAGVAIAAWLALFGDTTPSDRIVEPVPRAAVAAPAANARDVSAPSKTAAPGRQASAEPAILRLQPRDALIGGDATRPDDRLFASQTWAPPPPPPPTPAPPPPPTAPPLPFAYLGKKVEDNVWEVYLARGEQTFIARANVTIDGTYRIESITPPTLSIMYLPLNQIQTLIIGGTD